MTHDASIRLGWRCSCGTYGADYELLHHSGSQEKVAGNSHSLAQYWSEGGREKET